MAVRPRMSSSFLLVLCQLLASVNCEVTPIKSHTDYPSTSLCPGGKWTEWFDIDDPQSSRSGGDYELLADMMEMFGVCETPTYIECKDVGSPLFYYEMPDQTKVTCLPDVGLLCFNKDQKSSQCADYEVRFFCPCSDDDIVPEVQPDVQFCPDGKWTEWIDMENPSPSFAGGDYELLGEIMETVDMCLHPTDIECRVVGSASLYNKKSGQSKITCKHDVGLLCYNKDQYPKQCLDYEVRFFCPCFSHTVMPIQKSTDTEEEIKSKIIE